MNGGVTGFVWVRPLQEAKEHGRNVTVTLKGNGEDEFEGMVSDVDQVFVTLVDDDNTDELCVMVLLDDIAAVLFEKGHDD
jgi:hypothetical protein